MWCDSGASWWWLEPFGLEGKERPFWWCGGGGEWVCGEVGFWDFCDLAQIVLYCIVLGVALTRPLYSTGGVIVRSVLKVVIISL